MFFIVHMKSIESNPHSLTREKGHLMIFAIFFIKNWFKPHPLSSVKLSSLVVKFNCYASTLPDLCRMQLMYAALQHPHCMLVKSIFIADLGSQENFKNKCCQMIKLRVVVLFSKMSLVCLSSLWQCPSLKSDNIVSTHHNVMLEIVVDDNHLFTE